MHFSQNSVAKSINVSKYYLIISMKFILMTEDSELKISEIGKDLMHKMWLKLRGLPAK